MKKIVGSVLVVLLLSVATVQAGVEEKLAGLEADMKDMKVQSEAQMKKVALELGLSGAQKKKVEGIVNASFEKSLHALKAETVEKEKLIAQHRQTMGAIRQDYELKMIEVLGPDQFKKWEAAMLSDQKGQGPKFE